ncbi:DUF6232 family protein [Streptomyces sp. NBC_00233]|uniref:DUF6232 family protein n=1 Tax=Streptomyces sp. NBC_00233 TaxID=2975686 RepID=UPI00225C2A5A|nr:DUF6232 family protein [Streptomyces sp. NBC_00233]MCX5229389.1 DUF6232 family protein [Streptomyces sp. NBC_00233]
MTFTGDAGPPPPRPPSDPPSGPPSVPPPGSPSGPPEPPPSVPPGARWGGVLQLRVSRRMLWVGSAAFPLHNITRVEAFKLRPDRGAALLRFLKWLFVAIVIYAVVNSVSDGEASVGDGGGPLLFVVLVALAVFLGKELFESAKPVLLVEMASGSAVLVTLPNMEELRDIAGLIARAIDNPAAEFSTVVRQFNNTNNYGTVVNMNGGRNNRGINL